MPLAYKRIRLYIDLLESNDLRGQPTSYFTSPTIHLASSLSDETDQLLTHRTLDHPSEHNSQHSSAKLTAFFSGSSCTESEFIGENCGWTFLCEKTYF